MTEPYPPQPPGWRPLPKHPDATTVLVLGILGIVLCGVLAPFAWVMGNKALREIDANPGQLDGRSEANAGRILGIIGTVILVCTVLFVIGIAVIAIGASVSTVGSTSGGY